jgi:predicted lipoprotein with Yx(FWY)xxD motif
MSMGKFYCAFLLLVVLAIAVAGCGDSEDGPGPGAYGLQSEKERTIAQEEAKQEKIESRPKKKGFWGVAFGAGTEEGMLIVDLAGHTLYTFDKDKGSTSTCYGACAKAWPPALTEDKARAGGTAQPDKVGTTKRRGGTIQLTYAGHPLYRYSRDRQSDANGNGIEAFGGTWHAIRPNGEMAN